MSIVLGPRTNLQKTIATFQAKFKESPLRNKEGRAERIIRGDVLKACDEVVDKIIQPGSFLPVAKMQAEMAPSLFGAVKNLETAGTERGRCPCLRVQVMGTRTVVLVRCQQLKEYMVKCGLSTITQESMQNYLKAMSKEVVDAFCATGTFYHGTIGALEALWVPFDYMFLEVVGRDSDTIGFRYCMFMKSDADDMEKLSRWFISIKKPNAILQNASEAMILEPPDVD